MACEQAHIWPTELWRQVDSPAQQQQWELVPITDCSDSVFLTVTVTLLLTLFRLGAYIVTLDQLGPINVGPYCYAITPLPLGTPNFTLAPNCVIINLKKNTTWCMFSVVLLKSTSGVVKYLNTQASKYYLSTVTGIWKQYLNTPKNLGIYIDTAILCLVGLFVIFQILPRLTWYNFQ